MKLKCDYLDAFYIKDKGRIFKNLGTENLWKFDINPKLCAAPTESKNFVY